MSEDPGSGEGEQGQRPSPAATTPSARHWGDSIWGWLRRNPAALTYVLGPVAILLIVFLRQHHLLAQKPLWLYIAVICGVMAMTFTIDRWQATSPSRLTMQASVAGHVLAVTLVIYLAGWGPELVIVYAFVAIIDISANGSRSWTVSLFWSIGCIAVGQAAIYLGVVPTIVPESKAQAVCLLGTVLLVFVARVTATTNRLREDAERTIAASEDRFRSLVQNSSDTTLVIRSDTTLTFASPAIFRFLGRTPEEVVGQCALDLMHPDERDEIVAHWISQLTESEVEGSGPVRFVHADGSFRYAEVVLSDLQHQPSVDGFVANLRDITERKAVEDKMAHMALHDHLTGLINRAVLVDRLTQAIARRNRHGGPDPVVMFLDLNRFKAVNDRLGHAAGDELLVAVAARIRSVLRETDSLARFGGDEFVLLCEEGTDLDSVNALAERARAALAESFTIGGHPLEIGVSIGIAVVDEADAAAEQLLADADYAMYLAKSSGARSGIRVFDGAVRTQARERVAIEMDLADAVADGALSLAYQPIIDLRTGRPAGVEALLRWHHPERGLLEPQDFLHIAEQTGLIVPIGTWVMQTACAQVAAWNAALPPEYHVSVSVNLSLREVNDPHLVDVVSSIVERTGLWPEELGLMIEFSDTPGDGSDAMEHLVALHDLGVQLAIDGFGPGHAFLRNLHELPINAVKLDRSLLGAGRLAQRDDAVLRSVTDLAHTLGMLVMAAGVETQEQLASLGPIGCDFAQGFLLGRPEPADVVAGTILAALQPDQPSAR